MGKSSLNPRIWKALEILNTRDGKRRNIYEAGDSIGRGCGEWYIEYTRGGPCLNPGDISQMLHRRLIRQIPDAPPGYYEWTGMLP